MTASVWGGGVVPAPLWAFALNEGAGNTIYDSCQGFPGTLTNGPTWVASPYGPALNFASASSQYIELNDPTPWVETTRSFTVAALISQTGASTGNRGGVISRGSTSGLSAVFDLSAWDDGITWQFELYDGSNNPVASVQYTPAQWDVMVGVRDVEAGTIYLYGGGTQLVSTSDTTGNLNVGTQHWTIGRRADQGSYAGYFNGKIAGAAAWNVALSSSVIRNLTNNFWQIWQPSSHPSYFLFTPVSSITLGVAAVAASGTIGAATEQAIVSEAATTATGTLGAETAGPSPSFSAVSTSGGIGSATEQVVIGEASVVTLATVATTTESAIISEAATTSVGTVGSSSTSSSGSASAPAVSASGSVGSISVVAGSAVSVSVQGVAAVGFTPGTNSWQQAKTLPATISWLPIPGTSTIWQSLPIGTTISVAKYDGTSYSQIEAFTVGDGTLVDSSGASVGVDSLWYWDVWAWSNPATWYAIPGSYSTWGSLPVGTTILASKYDGTYYSNLDAFTVGNNVLIDPTGASTGVDSLWYWDLWSYVTSGVVADVIVDKGAISGAGTLGTTSVVTGSGITVSASGVSAIGSVGAETALAIISEASVAATGNLGAETASAIVLSASVATSGSVGSFSVIAGTTLTVTASAVSASGTVGGDLVLAIISEAAVTASVASGVQTAGPGPIASAVSASGTTGATSEPQSITLAATSTSGSPAAITAGPIVLSSGVASSATVGASRESLAIGGAATQATGSTAAISIFNGGVITVSAQGVAASGVTGISGVSLVASAPSVSGAGILGAGIPAVTLYVKSYPDPFSANALTRIDVFGSAASEGTDPFGSSAGYRGS